jgi:hypothetical protein
MLVLARSVAVKIAAVSARADWLVLVVMVVSRLSRKSGIAVPAR